MDGRQLVLATHPTLASLGIASKLQRMQLLNRRDELLLLEDDHQGAPHQNGAHVSQIYLPSIGKADLLCPYHPRRSSQVQGNVYRRRGDWSITGAFLTVHLLQGVHVPNVQTVRIALAGEGRAWRGW